MTQVPGLSSRPAHREIELDFIRGIAILLVIDFHSEGHSILLAPFLMLGMKNFGWAGVDLFFVLSGFLVGGLLVKEWKLHGRIHAQRFLVRRGLKIWPQYYVFLFLGLLAGHRRFGDQWGNLLNLQNYIGPKSHTWTLAVEEHAYLLLVLILSVASRKATRVRRVFLLLASLAGAVLVNRVVEAWLGRPGLDVFIHTDTRLDGILYGVMLAMLYHFAPERFAMLQRRWPLWVGVLLVTLIYLRFSPHTFWAWPMSWFLADMCGIAALMLLYRRGVSPRRPFWYRWIAAIGLYSYGIYLWHVSVLVPVKTLTPHLPASVAPVWMACGPYLLGIPLGIVFTRLIEFPALRVRDRLFPRRIDSAVGIPAAIEDETGITGQPESIASDPQ